MAQSAEPVVPAKRGVGRPKRDATQPPAKKAKVSLPPKEATPIATASPIPQSTPKSGLPAKLSAAAPLPTLPQPQAADLSDSEYQSLASSAVLAASLERSRQAWTHDGIFQRFWTKPEGKVKGVDPLFKAMKSRGRCRLRIEPHIFEVEVWVVERPKPAPPPPAPRPQAAASYGSAYRPQASSSYATPQQHAPYHQNRTAVSQQPTPSRVLSPANIQPIPPAVQHRQAPTQPTPPPARAADSKKPSPDPVISMLATRASSDPELKALMKEVATGKATQDQLRVFQKHIDELTAMIQANKAKEEGTGTPQPAVPQYDGAGDEPPPQPRPYTHQQPSYTAPRQQPQTYTPPAPPAPPEVVFSFTATGSTEDRFLFPQHSILEPLSQQHVLASFIVTRRGHTSPSHFPNPSLDPDTEYWQPVTLMVEVAYGRENILKDVSRWVKPAEEVREEMRRVMARCTRAPDAHLALRLPHKGVVASAAGSEDVSKAGTPVVEVEKKKKAVKKTAVAKPASVGSKGKEKVVDDSAVPAAPGADKTTAIEPQTEAGAVATKDGVEGVKQEKEESNGRPKRVTRKSVRISEA